MKNKYIARPIKAARIDLYGTQVGTYNEVSSSVPYEHERILHTKLGDMESLYLELVETVKLIKRDIKWVEQDPDMVDQVSEDLETALDAVREIHQIMSVDIQ